MREAVYFVPEKLNPLRRGHQHQQPARRIFTHPHTPWLYTITVLEADAFKKIMLHSCCKPADTMFYKCLGSLTLSSRPFNIHSLVSQSEDELMPRALIRIPYVFRGYNYKAFHFLIRM